MLIFRHLNLEVSETEYKGKKIEVRQNAERTWDMWINGNKIEHEPFFTRKEAINHIISVIKSIDPTQVSEPIETNEEGKTRPKHKGRPKASQHSSMKPASKELKPRRVR